MIDGFEQYDLDKCSPPVEEHPDPPDPHDQCEREIEQLHRTVTELAAQKPLPVTYRDLFAAVSARGTPGSFVIRVETWCHTPLSDVASRWQISWFANPHDCRTVGGATAAEAFARFCAEQPAADRTGIGDLVGEGKVTP